MESRRVILSRIRSNRNYSVRRASKRKKNNDGAVELYASKQYPQGQTVLPERAPLSLCCSLPFCPLVRIVCGRYSLIGAAHRKPLKSRSCTAIIIIIIGATNSLSDCTPNREHRETKALLPITTGDACSRRRRRRCVSCHRAGKREQTEPEHSSRCCAAPTCKLRRI